MKRGKGMREKRKKREKAQGRGTERKKGRKRRVERKKGRGEE